jgi:hypothetical protein
VGVGGGGGGRGEGAGGRGGGAAAVEGERELFEVGDAVLVQGQVLSCRVGLRKRYGGMRTHL